VELEAEIVSKVETKQIEGETIYWFHIKLRINREDLEAQGGGILAQFKVDQESFNAREVGDILTFKEIGE
jgi:hypothetical protein